MSAAAFMTGRRASVFATTKTSRVNLFIGDRTQKENIGSDHLTLLIQASVQHESGRTSPERLTSFLSHMHQTGMLFYVPAFQIKCAESHSGGGGGAYFEIYKFVFRNLHFLSFGCRCE